MLDLADKNVLVVGFDPRGMAAAGLLRRAGARVVAVAADEADVPPATVDDLRSQGIEVQRGTADALRGHFDLVVLSPEAAPASAGVAGIANRDISMIGELELGWRLSKCLAVAVSGTNGKGTTAGLIEQMLVQNHRTTVRAGHRSNPVGCVADQTAALDFLILQVNALQLQATQFFRPAVAVLLNAYPDHGSRFPGNEDLLAAYGNLFRNQQVFDWSIVQLEALKQLQSAGITPPGKIITFSGADQDADLFLDRGLILSRFPNWEGPLLDMQQCQLRGLHNAENLMAALAVGRALRLPLETMVETLKQCEHADHRFQIAGEWRDIQFIDDSKSTNPDALHRALESARPGEAGKPNVWVIAGGRDSGGDFHRLSPLVSRRVKGAFLIGEAREKIRSAWGLFTPCTLMDSLLEAVTEAARNAVPGDVVLLSPACSSFDQFQDYQERGECFCAAVKSISSGAV
ncbi:MAG TPA: UDP-N-acetylmuramoyl-L-alanine--D-glutamate ligase [Verrucomicrobiae bacterium]|nr:UDP-N-acetylmuramoyl-L-alanine--D-glutamate ligase [Verrucomicrobiae bacterium]